MPCGERFYDKNKMLASGCFKARFSRLIRRIIFLAIRVVRKGLGESIWLFCWLNSLGRDSFVMVYLIVLQQSGENYKEPQAESDQEVININLKLKSLEFQICLMQF